MVPLNGNNPARLSERSQLLILGRRWLLTKTWSVFESHFFFVFASITRKSGLILVSYVKYIVCAVTEWRTSSLNTSRFPVRLCQDVCLDLVETFTSSSCIYLYILLNHFRLIYIFTLQERDLITLWLDAWQPQRTMLLQFAYMPRCECRTPGYEAGSFNSSDSTFNIVKSSGNYTYKQV